MGHHFVPQRYLLNFQSSGRPGWIWMFDKLTRAAKHLPVRQVAQAPGFYDPDVEKSLNFDVEIPGSGVIDKILSGEHVSDDPADPDRKDLTYYVATMLKRVPYARNKAQRFVPGAIAEVSADVRKQFIEAERTGLIMAETLQARLAEVDAIERRALQDPPNEVTRVVDLPWPFVSWLHAVHHMHWRVLRSRGPSYFLTSDNPAYFFKGFGLGHPECELILPLSSHVLLHCSWRARGRPDPNGVSQQLVKEMNRRIASGAERFVFYHASADWVFSAAQNKPE